MRRAALVTGASSGIGAATCRRLREEGWHVVGVGAQAEPRCERVAVRGHHALRRSSSRHFRSVPRTATARPRRRDDRPGGAAACERPRRLAASRGGQPARHLQRPARGAGGSAGAGRRPGHPPHQRSRVHRKAILERVQRLEGGRRAPRPLGRDRRRRHRLRRLLARSGDHRDPDAGGAALVDFPDRDRFVRVYEERSGRTPEEVAAAVCELSRREPSALNGQTFRVGAL